MTRICFLNPFGTDAYDDIVERTLQPSLAATTTVEIRHLDHGPADLDYFVAKHLVEVEILRTVRRLEAEGFDAVVIGCCYDPALTQARELVDIPVVGPLEASVSLARLFGHRFAVATDHHKAVPELEDRIRLYGLESNCRGVRSIGWFVTDMINDPDQVARDLYQSAQEILDTTGAETVLIGCTIIAACYEQAVLNGAAGLADRSIVNPNVLAVKLAELLAQLQAVGQYRISRDGYYQRQHTHDSSSAEQVLQMLDTTALESIPRTGGAQ